MGHRWWVLALASCLAAGASAQMTKQEFRAERMRLQDQYGAARNRCGALADEQQKLCETQARSELRSASAELRARYKPGTGTRQRADIIKAETDYEVAKARCADMKGSARKVCRDEARAGWKAARSQARADAKTAGKGLYSAAARGARMKAQETQTQALYDAERERCRTLPAADRQGCVSDAKKRFAMY